MTVLRVAAWQKRSIYLAVRLFGGLAWKRNRWDREAGFQRVLVDYGLRALDTSRRPGFLSRTIKRMRRRSSD
ncbi:MAG: hypothetical protein JXR55_03875 [Candidatus Fermentibacteraceae bacterium]|nr:hypothetical protein [Candidatus Fermentibacteraceae bacterium]